MQKYWKRIASLLCAGILCAGWFGTGVTAQAAGNKDVNQLVNNAIKSIQEEETETTDEQEEQPSKEQTQKTWFYEDGDIVGFIGDSITHVEYSSINYAEFLYNYYISRFPDRKIEFRNLGVSSYKASDILNIYDRDPAFEGLTKAVIMLGMNEALEKDSTETYITNMGKLVEKLKADGLTGEDILVLSPTPYDQTCTANFDKNGKPYRMTDDALTEFTEQLAIKVKEWDVRYVDLHTPMVELTKEIQKEDNNNTLTVWDCVHPNAMGEMAMAYYILQAQGTDNLVAEITVPENGEVKTAKGEMTDFYRGENGICWNWKPETLPMAMTYEFQEFHQLFDLVGALNQAPLKIAGLEPESTYTLWMDETEAGTFTGQELAEGVNLAILETNPLQAAMMEVEELNQQWHDTSAEYRRIVRYATMEKPTHTMEQMQEAYEVWKEAAADLQNRMYEIAKEAVGQSFPMTVIREGGSKEELWQEADAYLEQAAKEAEEAREKEEAASDSGEQLAKQPGLSSFIKIWLAAVGVAAVLAALAIGYYFMKKKH